MTQEVLKLALDALERLRPEGFFNEAITAIKEALREHAMREVQRLGQEIEQEPVVGIAAIRTWFKDGRVVTQTLCNSWIDTTPPQRGKEPVKYSDYEPDGVHHNKSQQEPVAWLSTDSIGERHLCFDKPLDNDPVQPLYTTPPQRKPLTQDGTMEIANQTAGQYWMDEAHIQRFRAAVEAAHGIKEKT
jgi:hypothetical protein